MVVLVAVLLVLASRLRESGRPAVASRVRLAVLGLPASRCAALAIEWHYADRGVPIPHDGVAKGLLIPVAVLVIWLLNPLWRERDTPRFEGAVGPRRAARVAAARDAELADIVAGS